MKCSIRGCDDSVLVIIEGKGWGYCLKHWRHIAGNYKHFNIMNRKNRK